MSSYVQHFSDGSVWGCLDDFFGPHEYGYIKLKGIEEWHSEVSYEDWKKRAITGEEFKKQTLGLQRVHEVSPIQKPEELKPLSQKRAEAIERGKGIPEGMTLVEESKLFKLINTVNNLQDHSILEKLREELERMKSEHKNESTDEFDMGVVHTSQYMLDLLTSLETKEEPQILFEDDKEVKELKEKIGMSPAQPQFQTQEDIELLPEFPNYGPGDILNIPYDYRLPDQVSLLTNRLNQLIKANKKLGK